MTTSTGSFRDWLCREIREVLGRPGNPPPFIVWCDPERSWLDLLHESSEADRFELWAPKSVQDEDHELILRDRFYSTPRKPRVIWLPCARDGITWFKVFELEADSVWEKSLLTALREYGVAIPREHEEELVRLLPSNAREWFDKPKETWKELTPGNAKGTLVDDQRMLQALGGAEGEFERLRAEGRFEIFARRATEDFGFPDPTGMNEETWRSAATARLLCTEAADQMPHEPPREADRIIPPGLGRGHALRMLKQWQNDIRYLANFEKLVVAAEATLGLTYWARNLTTMPKSRSSRAVEETLFTQTADRLDRLDAGDALAEELNRNSQVYRDRESGFWAKEATRKVGWRFLVELAGVAALLVENRGIQHEWKKAGDAVDWYVRRGWQLDQAGEQLFKEEADLPKELRGIRVRLRRNYLRTMDEVARTFSELLSQRAATLASMPTAGEVVLSELESQGAPTALLFLDACRLDLGWRLADLLNRGEPAQRANVHAAIAPLPSVTALGMPFALPIKRERLRVDLAADEKTFEVYADEFDGDMKWAEPRRKWLREKWDVKECLRVDQVLDGGDALKKPGRGRKLIAVFSDELDDHDGQLQLTGADDHLRRYEQAIRKLRDAGYSRVVVATDHGFFHWQPEDHEIEDELPSGKVLWRHRRAIVGRDLSHPTAVRMDVPRSQLEVAVPRGTNAFRTYGALGFFHGGATLQELIIPVVVVSWPVKARKVNVALKPVGFVASEVPRVQLQAGATGHLFNTDVNVLSRRVLVKIKDAASGKVVFKHADPVRIESDGAPVTANLSVVEPKPELPYETKLVVEVLDADDEELLAREEIELKIELSDF